MATMKKCDRCGVVANAAASGLPSRWNYRNAPAFRAGLSRPLHDDGRSVELCDACDDSLARWFQTPDPTTPVQS